MWGKLILAASQARDISKLVLICLGEHAERSGVTRHASVSRIAAFCGIHDRKVQMCIRDLIELGEIEIANPGGGRGNPASYRILLKWQKETRFWPLKGANSQSPLSPKKGARVRTL